MPANPCPALPRLVRRILLRLDDAIAHESDLWLRDDHKIAKLTVLYAATGEAEICGPYVLASYEVLGTHPEKVWPKILARRKALGFEEVSGAAPVPKKPPQSVKLWFEKTNAARVRGSRGAMQNGLRDQTISVPMAAPSIAALYRNPEEPSSAKKRPHTLSELTLLVAYSGAPHSVRAATLAALRARGPWPNQDGPATTVIQVSLAGMMVEGNCCRSTAQRRIKRACHLGYWQRTREANSWNNCPKCGASRSSRKCGQCPYIGSRKNKGEFSPTFTYEFDVLKFIGAKRCREIHSEQWRSYQELKSAKVTEMPARKPAENPPPKPPTPAAPQPQRRTAQHGEIRRAEKPKLSKSECAKFVSDLVTLIQRSSAQVISVTPDPACKTCRGHGSYPSAAHPGESLRCHCSERSAKLTWREALRKTAQTWSRDPEAIVEALKFHGYTVEPDVGA
jgi:hypothetical protein